MNADVLVIGAGPAGLTAALSAAEGGAHVLLLDNQPRPGGQIWRGTPAGSLGQAGALLKQVQQHPLITHWTGSEVAWVEEPLTLPRGEWFSLAMATPAGLRKASAPKVILATGATERFLPFPGWTLPGVVGAGGLQAMLKSGLDVRGQRVVVAGSGPLLLAVAATARERGARVLGIAEQAGWPGLARFGLAASRLPGKGVEAFQLLRELRSIPYWANSYAVLAEGDGRLQHVTLRRAGRDLHLDCDVLAVGFGLVPETRVAQLLGCALTPAGAVQVSAWQQSSVRGVYAAGEITGIGGVDKAIHEGFVAGCAATGQVERLRDAADKTAVYQHFQDALEHSFALRPELRNLPAPDTIVCRCEDVTHGELRQHTSWTEAKLHTRCGMGACQGRVCGPATETLYGWPFTGVRAPLTPLPLAQLLNDP